MGEAPLESLFAHCLERIEAQTGDVRSRSSVWWGGGDNVDLDGERVRIHLSSRHDHVHLSHAA